MQPLFDKNQRKWLKAAIVVATVFCTPILKAAVFQVPENGDSVVGQLQQITLNSTDTFVDVARAYNVGYNELVAANPNVDPWLPGAGTQIVLPTQYILPNEPWKGIIVNIAEMRMYYFPESKSGAKSVVYTFPIGIGRENWETPLGDFHVIEKMVDPVWTVPDSVLAEAKKNGTEMPAVIPPGPDNPLGKHALMLDAPGYLIHGTNKPLTIGRRVSHGCLRMYPEDVEQLIFRVPRGVDVKIVNEPVKVGKKDNVLFLEMHPPLIETKSSDVKLRAMTVTSIENYARTEFAHQVWQRVFDVSSQLNGVPIPISELSQQNNNEQWVLRIESTNNGSQQQPLVSRFKELALPVVNPQCHPFQPCVDLGPFFGAAIRDATAELIKFGFGLYSLNLMQNVKLSDSEL
ncbi:L,D-transpeptidase family protein [Kaarinaea lacus]